MKASGNMKVSMVSELLGECRDKQKPEDEWNLIRDVAGVTYGGKFGPISSFYLRLTGFPMH